jgi:hypothetical protein
MWVRFAATSATQNVNESFVRTQGISAMVFDCEPGRTSKLSHLRERHKGQADNYRLLVQNCQNRYTATSELGNLVEAYAELVAAELEEEPIWGSNILVG